MYRVACVIVYFNSRPSARGDLNPPPPCAAVPLFQFTPLREGRHARYGGIEPTDYFNSRPSARGDTGLELTATTVMHFNSRPSARGDISAMLGNMCRESFQFTPLREGRQNGCVIQCAIVDVFQFTPLREGRQQV